MKEKELEMLEEKLINCQEDNYEEDDTLNALEDIFSDLIGVGLDTSELEDIKIDKKEFEKGVKSVSKIAGMFSCLKNVGMDTDSAFSYIINERNIEHSQIMQKMINKDQKEVAKIQSLQIDNQQV